MKRIAWIVILLAIALPTALSNTPTDRVQALQADPLEGIYFIVHTSGRDNAGTDEDFRFEIWLQGADSPMSYNPPNRGWDENETGRTETYYWDLGGGPTLYPSSITRSTVCVRILGDDAWQPDEFWVIGYQHFPSTNTYSNDLLTYADWNGNYILSSDRSEGWSGLLLDRGVCRG